MNILANNMRKFWNSTAERNAHLGKSGEGDFLLERAKMMFERISIKGKIVVDFGCGGGYTGKYLLQNGIKRYIGYDLADRSIAVAKETLKDHSNIELIHLIEHRWNFAEKAPDIVVCTACIIHFPTKIYLDNFLQTCNESGAKYLILEIRDTGKGTQFQHEPYTKGLTQTCLACITNEAYVSVKLDKYTCVKRTDATKAPTNCQILWYKLNA